MVPLVGLLQAAAQGAAAAAAAAGDAGAAAAAAAAGAAAAAAAAANATAATAASGEAAAGDHHAGVVGFFVQSLPMTVMLFSYLLGALIFRGALPLMLFNRTLYWYLGKPEERGQQQQQGGGGGAAAGAPAGASQPSPGKKGRKAAAKAAASLGGSTARLMPDLLSADLLERLEFYEEFDFLLRAALMVAFNTGGTALIRVFVSPDFPAHAMSLFVTCVVTVVFYLYKVEWAHDSIGRQERCIMALVGAFAGMAALVLLLLAPAGTLPFSPGPAAREAMERMAAVARRRLREHVPEHVLQPSDNPHVVGAGLALLGGALGGMLLSPGIRYGRVLHTFTDLPAWARFARPSWGVKLLVQAGFAVQLLLTPLCLSTTASVLPLSPEQLTYARGLVMVAAAVLQLAAMPHVVQTFLHAVALSAHVVSTNPAVSDSLRATAIKKTVTATLSQTIKVSAQLSFVPVLLLGCGLMHTLMSFPSPLAAVRAGVAELDKGPSELVLCVAGFLGWWASSAYMLWASLGLLLGRLNAAGIAS